MPRRPAAEIEVRAGDTEERGADHARITRLEIQSAHPRFACQPRVDDEALEGGGTAGFDDHAGRRRQLDIGSSEHPVRAVVDEFWRFAFALRHSAIDPGNEELEFARRQPDVSGEPTVSPLGRPWRHATREDLILDGLCPWPRILVGG